MKAQVSVTVKDGIFTRSIAIKRTAVKAYIDPKDENHMGEPLILKGGKEPHLIDLQPGPHMLAFEDTEAGMKTGMRKLVLGAVGAGIGLGVGDFMSAGGASSLASDFAGMVKPTVREGVVRFSLQEGEVLHLLVTPTNSGKVKIKVLDKD